MLICLQLGLSARAGELLLSWGIPATSCVGPRFDLCDTFAHTQYRLLLKSGAAAESQHAFGRMMARKMTVTAVAPAPIGRNAIRPIERIDFLGPDLVQVSGADIRDSQTYLH